MAPKPSIDTPSPAASSVAISRGHSRRPSHASQSAQPALDKEKLSSALDEIHTSASRSGTLTTFDDFTSPRPGSKGEARGFAEDIVQSGFSGLYNRLKASVGAARDAVAGGAGNDSADDESIGSAKAKSAALKGHPSGIVASPTTASTSSSSKIHSPLTGRFPEFQAGSGHNPPPPPTVLAPSRSSNPNAVASPVSNAQLRSTSHKLEESSASPTAVSHRIARQAESSFPASNWDQDTTGVPLTRSRSRPGRQSTLDRQNEATISSRQESDLISTFADNCDVVDPDRTPRNTNKSSDRPVLTVETSNKPSSKSYKQFSPSLAGPDGASLKSDSLNEAYPSPQRPPLIQVSQSHLPGFRASRTNSSDGDLSSVVTTAARSNRPNFELVEERGTNFMDHDADSSHTISRMRSKILAKELWMRDENAKDCFYCGDTFSAFRRKHHCRKWYSRILSIIPLTPHQVFAVTFLTQSVHHWSLESYLVNRVDCVSANLARPLCMALMTTHLSTPMMPTEFHLPATQYPREFRLITINGQTLFR
jgi:1-phosphatidylinositol-3-phosphate 5-kinase